MSNETNSSSLEASKKTGEMLQRKWRVEAGFLLNRVVKYLLTGLSSGESFSHPGPTASCIFTKYQLLVGRQVAALKSHDWEQTVPIRDEERVAGCRGVGGTAEPAVRLFLTILSPSLNSSTLSHPTVTHVEWATGAVTVKVWNIQTPHQVLSASSLRDGAEI